MKKIDISEMKAKYVNQTFGWLTVIDVYRDESSKRYFFKCLCKCGKETCKPYNKVISGHTSSCGCYRFSKEYSESLVDYWKLNPDKVKNKTDKVKQWVKDNPDKVAERGQKHSQFYKDNPEVLISQKEKRRHTLENNPSIQETINENIKLSWTDEKRDEFSKERKQYYIDHPEVSCKVSSSLIKFYKDNPNKKTEISVRNKKWCENNKDKLSEFGKNRSDCLKSKRLSFISNNDVTNIDHSNDLLFITDLADKNGLSYFINDRGDLEIRDKNICFHLANMTSGEKDSYDRWYYYHSIGVRCVFVYPPDLANENKINVYKNILLYHCKLTKRIYARNTVVAKYPAIKMKSFFDENNIAGYRNSKTAYVLEDKVTHESYMCYLIGHSYFGKGNYDCEIARGACKLGYSIIGGVSKLWKYILNDNPTINSIVYYCDRRQYDQRSISHLMDSSDIKNLGHVYMLNGNTSFMNYWIRDSYINDKLWHRSGEYTNREPHNHKFVVDAINKGYCISVYNPGSFVNVFVRKGYHLNGLKVVRD